MSTQRADPGLEAVAIIGMSCRFPGAAGVEELWRNLRDGVESVCFFERRALEEAGVSRSLLDDPAYVPAQAVLDGTDLFDAGFFGFTPRVAETTDPQHRIFLECSWEALERAGYDPAAYRGAIGLFAGVGMNSYLLSHAGHQEQLLSAVGGQQAAIGNRTDHLTTMVAYKLDLRGPAVTVQTTCSTSLVAVHLACQSLLNYQCHMALAGGARVAVPQAVGYVYRPGGIHSPDGHCRPFDARAQGTLTGSGAGVVVLKRLADAVKDGDDIHAVIRGTAINNDGAVKAGYTAPSVEGQAKVVATAQAVAGVHPEEIGYIEAHGTATPLGDPIELAALTRVFRAKTGRRGFCALGAVKSNFGHLDTAAGMAGLIKTALALQHGQIPPTLHFERPNPELRLEESPFYVPTTLTEWRPEGRPRRAGVSAFGIGGTNAHVILEEAPPAAPAGPSRAAQLLLLSARTASALEAVTDNLRRHLETETSQALADVAYTLRVGRRPFEIRRAVVCHDRAEAVELLGSLHPGRVHTSLQEPRQRPLTFLFPGQGAQRAGMGTELYRTEEGYRHEVDRCCEILDPWLGLDLRRELLAPEEESRLDETFLTQPALFVLEYALARLWISWGISPQAMIGHSLGEYVAACLAGVFSLESALRLVAGRGRLMQELPLGAMLSVQLPEEELRQRLGESLSLAAVNRPSLCVASGPVEEIDRLERELSAREIACRRLRTSRAFHSALVEPVLARFAEQLAGIELKVPAIPFLSNLTGRWIRPDEATDPGYWVRHLRSTVRFGDGVEELLRQGEGVLLEVGPGRTLSTFVRQHPAWTVNHLVLASLHGRQQDSEPAALLTTLGRLWVAGTPVAWSAFHAGERRRRVVLPTYPFERQRYWLDPKTGSDGVPVVLQGEWKKDLADWFWVPSWRRAAPPALLRREPLEPGRRWLVLADEAGLGDAISARLEQLGQEVLRVAAGEGFSRNGRGYTFSPGRSGDYRTLIEDLRASGRMPHRIVHLWNVDPTAGGLPDVPGRALQRGFFSLLFLAQALGAEEGEPPLRIDVVSTGMHEVSGGDLRAPEKAVLLGPCKVIPKEYPNLRCRSIDLSGPEEVEPLLAELLADATEGMVAHRGGHRWIQSFEPIRLECPAEGAGLRRGGVYLVTGGFGGMGSALAEHLARACAAKLVLTGRSPLPPREDWDGWLAAQGEEDPASRRIRQVQALEAMGAEVLAAGVDVTDLEGMRGVLAEARRRFGPVRGVFHTAGVSPGGLAQLKTADAASRILAPKLEGTRVLASLLAGEDLDFFLLCSSRSAIFGPAGGIDYTAANAFLDAFAHAARTAGLPRVVSINWCGWEDIGMMAEAARDRKGLPATYGEPVAHPLLDRRRVEPGREVYLAEYSARTHWVLNEHRIAGNPVVPGTTYLEMARAAAALRGLERIEILDVFFLTPLRLREDESREVRLLLEETEGRLEFQVVSRPGRGAGSWQKHVLGRVEPLAPGEPGRRDLAAIRRRCSVREVTVLREEQSEDLGPRWQNVTRVHVGDGEVLAVLELPADFAGDLASCSLHPALLDRAASIGEGYLGEGGGYLPFSYRSLRLFAPLPNRLYSHARLTTEEQSRGETISFDVDLLDESGNLLVEIRSYYKKRINDAAERLRLPEATATPSRAPLSGDLDDAEVPAEPAARMGISPPEGIDVFRRILAQPWVPQIVVSPNNLLEAIAALEAHRPLQLDPKAEAGTATQGGPRHDRPDLTSPYAPPESEMQAQLAEIWRELLGFREVGIHDNFFELGGDSVVAIQILTRARKIGIEISPGEIFEHQTIAELAAQLARKGLHPEDRELAAPPIVPVPRDRHLPLSFAQERLWFLAQLDPDSPAYNLPTAIRMTGRLDLASLAGSLQEIVRRHEVLRTRFAEVAGRPVQIVEPAGLPEIGLVDLSGLEEKLREPVLRSLIAGQAARPFDLTRVPLLRMTLFRLGGEEHLALTVLHHAVADGWSLGLFLHEFEHHYAARTSGRPLHLRDLPVQYADYSAWQRSWLSGEVLERKLEFWRQLLAGVPPILDLSDSPRPARKGFRAGTCAFRIPAALATEFSSVGRQREATLFMTLLAVFETLLSRYSGREELVIGTPVANRDRPEVEGLIGMFVNTLALRADLTGDPTFLDLLERVRRQMPAVHANQDLPFERLVNALDLPRSMSHAPLVQVMLVMRNYAPVEHVTLEGLKFESLLTEAPGTPFDLSLVVAGGGEDDLRCLLEYDRELFDASTVRRMADHFVELLRSVGANPDRRVSELPLLSTAESHQLLLEWSDTSVADLPGESISQLFEKQVARTPDRVALIHGQARLSYRELDQSANRLAHHLRSLGVGPETVVGVCMKRSPWMMMALLGILKTGAAYLPLDPAYPGERLAFMVEDSGTPILIAESASADRLPAGTPLLLLPENEALLIRQPAHGSNSGSGRDSLAYVIYTSGSTGKPKGVMVTHGGVINFFAGMDERLGCEPAGTWLSVTSVSFDISVLELFWTLTRGFRVILGTDRFGMRADALRSRISQRKMEFSLSYFASDDDEQPGERYRLLLEGAKFADRHGFAAVWTPERHFHAFGGIFPNPSVVSAAVAAFTSRIGIRAGSVVLPLHNPARVAEEWSVVDNLSHGRVGISFASGWHPDDFVFAPESFARRKNIMLEGIETVRRLWRGEAIPMLGGGGQEIQVRIRPRPVQPELPVWFTSTGSEETFRAAGEAGAGLLTHLLGQSVEELAEKIAVYQKSWRPRSGGFPEAHVSLMLHTFVDPNPQYVRDRVREPFTRYLGSALGLIQNFARSLGRDMNAADFTDDDRTALLEHAFRRYYETSSLFGTPETCLAMVEHLREIGVAEIACLIDFGVDVDSVLASLEHLDRVRELSNAMPAQEEDSLAALVTRHSVSHLQCTPSYARMLSTDPQSFDSLCSVACLIVGGEALPPDLARLLCDRISGEVHNMYGPTETTIWSATARMDGAGAVSIGRPIANTQIYVVDRQLREVPQGVVGELCIAGEGVARGYLGRPDVTAERFAPDPFRNKPGARLYRTGDLGRHRRDGALEYLGRIDQQVKIRGFRIELGEIESILSEHEAVRGAAVLLDEVVEGGAGLTACVVPRTAPAPSIRELRKFLSEKLPDYMIPSRFAFFEELPFTPNGKVDRRELSRLWRSVASQASRNQPPQPFHTSTEELLAGIFADVLQIENAGGQDSFFELGGHSLLATQVISRVRSLFGIELPLRTLFEKPRVKSLASQIDLMRHSTHLNTEDLPLRFAPRQELMPVSPAQQRLWFLDRLFPETPILNMSTAVRLLGPLDERILAKSFNEIRRRHEILRATFSEIDGVAVQSFAPHQPLPLPQVDLSALPGAERELETLRVIHAEARRPFDLSQGPLLRALLVRLESDDHLVVYCLHHIAGDGWSMSLLGAELGQIYEAFAAGLPSPLPDLPLQYADYAYWQNLWLSSDRLEQQLAYWRRQLSGPIPPLTLPRRRQRPPVPTFRAANRPVRLPQELTTALVALGRREGATLFMVLLAGFNALLHDYTKQEDILVGADVASRGREEFEKLIGFFVNILLLRTNFAGGPSFRDLLRQVREVSLEAFANQDVPFERVVEAAQLRPSRSYAPAVQVMFVFQNFPLLARPISNLTMIPVSIPQIMVNFDLSLTMGPHGEGFFTYDADLFEGEGIERFARNFQTLLEEVVAEPGLPLSEVPIGLEGEDSRLVSAFNEDL